MKTREERTGRTPGRSYNGPPLASGAGDGPSPFLSRPSSPLGNKVKSPEINRLSLETSEQDTQDAVPTDTRVQHQSPDQADEPVAHSSMSPDLRRRRQRTKSMEGNRSTGSTYPPSRSASGVRPLTGGSPSFMMGSWAGYSSKAGIVGMGSHSLMQ